MNRRKLALVALLCATVAPTALAEIKHVEMRVEGMT